MLKKVFRNYIYSVGSIVIVSIMGFIATPMIIRFIGSTEFGIYQLLLQFMGYFILCDLGLTTPSCSLLNEAWVTQDRKYVIKTMKVLLKEYLKTIPFILLLAAISSYILLNLSLEEYDSRVAFAFGLMTCTAFLIPVNVFKDFIRASERSHILSKVNTAQLIVMSSLNIFLSYKGFGILGIAFSFFISIVLSNIFLSIYAYRQLSHMPIKNLKINIDISHLWNQSSHSFLQRLLGQLSYVTDTIILSFFMPEIAITRFVVGQKLCFIIDSILKNIGGSVWASLGTVKENEAELQRVVSFINRILLVIGFPTLFSLALNNKDFLNVWLGPGFYISDLFTWIAFSNVVIFGILVFWGWIFVSLGKYHLQTKTIVISGIINLSFSIILTKYFNELGPVLGTFAGFYGFYVWHLKYVMLKQLKLDVSELTTKFFILALAYLVLFQLSSYLKIFVADSWPKLILNLGTCYIPALLIALVIVIKKSDWKLLNQKLKLL